MLDFWSAICYNNSNMLKFKQYLKEEKVEKLSHLEHNEDHVINSGQKGFAHAFHNLQDVHHKLTNNGHNDTKITTKYDGSPAVVFGTHPESKKFFVGSKSVFNKTPKINYSHEDIDKNHGHAPGLVSKLKAALDHLPKIHKDGVYQADIMHSGDAKKEGNRVHYTPNTITYHHEADSEHGKKAMNSKLGVAVHTKYEGKTWDSMEAKHGADFELGDHKDVHQLPVEHDISKVNYPIADQNEYQKHVKKAVEHFKSMPKDGHDEVGKHGVHLKTYINKTVRDGSEPNFDDFHQHVHDHHQKKIDGVKTDVAKARHSETRENVTSHIKSNKEHFNKVLDMHKHLQSAKNVLTNALNSHQTVGHEIAGQKTNPEGYVIHRQGMPTKFVDRAEFSAANFARGDALKKGNK